MSMLAWSVSDISSASKLNDIVELLKGKTHIHVHGLSKSWLFSTTFQVIMMFG